MSDNVADLEVKFLLKMAANFATKTADERTAFIAQLPSDLKKKFAIAQQAIRKKKGA